MTLFFCVAKMNQHLENTIQNQTNVIKNISRKKGASERVAFFLDKDFFSEVFQQMRYQFRYFFSYITQGIFYPVFFILYNAFFKLTINGKERLKDIKGPVIFISNHIGFYDSFIFDLFVLPFSRIPPFRFMGTTKVIALYLRILKYTGILYLVYLLFGVIKVTYGKGAEIATIPAANVINRGGTVVIFPEGKIWTKKLKNESGNEPVGPFKWGAAILARNTGALVVPVSFRLSGEGWFIRKKLVVSIGESFRVDKYEKPEVVADEMRNKVIDLYNK